MHVFFTASFYGKAQYQSQYDLVREAIKYLHVTLISPEEGNYLDFIPKEKKKSLRDEKLIHYEAIRSGIHAADCVVIENSYEDFQLGHEATLAILEKKPVLCLSVSVDYSRRIFHEYFFAAKYTSETVTPILLNFFARSRELTSAKRFNMFLYPFQVEYLDKAGKDSGMNASEYVRHLINLDRRSRTLEE